ncbi:hypothetical protein AAAC05_35560 [Pseudomonas aeruginosa]|uniref:hypothetical protein n=1 Tax=Pseudomonas aeruginosa TaxID=287 RepID=UPI0030F301D7
MNTDTQTAYRSLATHFYTTRFPEIPVSALDELDEFRIIGALLRAAPSTGLTTSGGCVMHWPWTRSSGGRVEMAYVMGHQATDSIGRYGDKRYGRAEAVKVRPATALHAAC